MVAPLGSSGGRALAGRILAAWLLCLIPAGPASAMTLAESVSEAARSHPEVLAAAGNRRAMESRLRKTFSGYLPAIDLSTAYGREYSDNTTTRAHAGNTHGLTLDRGELGVTLNQMLFDGFNVKNRVRQAQAQLAAAEASQRRVTDLIALQAAEAHIDVVINDSQLQLIKDNVLLHQHIHKKVMAKYQGGAGNQADVHQATSRTYLASANHARTQAAHQFSLETFQKVVGRMPEGPVRPAFPETALPPSREGVMAAVVKRNPELTAARLNLSAAEAELAALRAAHLPKLNLELSANDNANIGGSEGHAKSASALLKLRYNLYRGGGDAAQIQEAAHRVEQATKNLDSLNRTLSEQVGIAWHKLAMARERVHFLEKHVAVSRDVTASYHDQFKMGKRTLLDVLNSENELFNARSALLSEEMLLLKTTCQLLTLMGDFRRVVGQAIVVPSPATAAPGPERPMGTTPAKTAPVEAPPAPGAQRPPPRPAPLAGVPVRSARLAAP